MYYTIFINDEKVGDNAYSHKEVSKEVNNAIIDKKIQSNLTTNNIISNWLSRGYKAKKWNFVKVETIDMAKDGLSWKSLKI